MGLSTNSFTYAGGAQTFTLSFALGYLDEADIEVFVVGEVDGGDNQIFRAFTFNSEFEVLVTDSLDVNDLVVTQRTVSKTVLEVDFTQAGTATRTNLSRSTTQAMMVIHEFIDGRIDSLDDAHPSALSAVAAAASQVAAGISEDAALASEVAAAASAALAATSETNADTAQTGAELAETGADASETAVAADLVLTNADVVLTGLDVGFTNADVVLTGLDVVLTAADVVSADAARVLSETAKTASEAAQTASEAALDELTDLYLGSKTSDPALDNDGNALQTGALYYNSVAAELRVYDGADWIAGVSAQVGGLLAENNLSDVDSVPTARGNLGLGDAAVETIGVADGNVIAADAVGLPVIDGSQLTGLVSGWELIADVLITADTNDITFTGVPATFKRLKLMYLCHLNSSGATVTPGVRNLADTTWYTIGKSQSTSSTHDRIMGTVAIENWNNYLANDMVTSHSQSAFSTGVFDRSNSSGLLSTGVNGGNYLAKSFQLDEIRISCNSIIEGSDSDRAAEMQLWGYK